MSQGRSRSRSPLRQQRDPHAKIRLARIFISHDGNNEYEWGGIAPKPGDTLFVYYVIVNDVTYSVNIPDSKDKSTFDHFRSKKNNVTISYLYGPNIIREAPPLYYYQRDSSFVNREKQNQEKLLLELMTNGRIFQNTDFSCWYELSNSDVYSNEYSNFKEEYDFFDVRVIDDHAEFNKKYIPLHTYVITNVDRHVLFRETGGSEKCFRCKLKIKKSLGGGGKTRRKFKVKKRRNRRIRNTMKRRKTAVKRRNR
jgi:hypothetical protein